jgi:hypothetical protein
MDNKEGVFSAGVGSGARRARGDPRLRPIRGGSLRGRAAAAARRRAGAALGRRDKCGAARAATALVFRAAAWR